MTIKIAVYPGTFDPFTYGHLDVVRRASKMFEKIIISVVENSNKISLFNIKERKEIIEDGFYPRRKRGQAIPINRTKYNRKAKAFIEARLNEVLPEMSNTMKKNLNTALRKGYDEVIKKGLTGAAGILASTPEAIAERIAVLQEPPVYIVVSIAFKIVTAASLISLISAISGMGGFILFFAVFYIYIRGVLTYDPNKYVKKWIIK